MSNANEDWSMWHRAAQRDEIDRALRGLYSELDAAVVERGPVCNASGRCCKFESFGHRLYVTGLEIAWFLDRAQEQAPAEAAERVPDESSPIPLQQLTPNPGAVASTVVEDACRYQVDGLCSTHAIRPLGCRVYFCEPGAEDWQQDTYERFTQQLKAIHHRHGLPYAYMEWRSGLIEADAQLNPRG